KGIGCDSKMAGRRRGYAGFRNRAPPGAGQRQETWGNHASPRRLQRGGRGRGPGRRQREALPCRAHRAKGDCRTGPHREYRGVMIRALLIALAVLPLSACGFTPVYGTGPMMANAGPINVLEIEGRTGHFLRQELVRTIGRGVPGVKGSAQLEVDLKQTIERLAFAPDQAASRSDYVGTATWT